MGFDSYTDCLLRAFILHAKPSEVIKRKKEILDEVATFYNYVPHSVLYIGFNPAILADNTPNIFVTEISSEAQIFLKANAVNFSFIYANELHEYHKKFDSVIALDEYFTFAADDNAQRIKITDICNLASEYLITTVKDYKNQDFKDREFSTPALLRNQKTNHIFLELHDHDLQDKNLWKTYVYQINDKLLLTNGPFDRRAMFFKQLAKFSHDAGAVDFNVHKNLMYKSLIKKNYEHVISIQFDNGS